MTKYFSTFISGLQEVVKHALTKKVDGVNITRVYEGLIVYEVDGSLKDIKSLRFFNNTFVLVELFNGGKAYTASELLNKLCSDPEIINIITESLVKDYNSFRVIASEENRLVSVDKELLSKVEELITKRLKLEVDRGNPDTEFWFSTRREGVGFIGMRIADHLDQDKWLSKGELRPELANIMCYLAELESSDTVLDPFAGYGAIPLECARSFQVSRVIASEKDKQVFKKLQDNADKLKKKIILGRWDALNINSLTDNSITKIITDPPWGVYEEKEDQGKFYENMLEEFIRILKPNGLVILLTSRKELFESILDDIKEFKLIEKYDILVSGKKAAIYKLGLM